MKKGAWINYAIILGVVALATFILVQPAPETSAEVAKCIGANSVIYVQLGCHACESQEEIFGENYQFLNSIDCFFEGDKCKNIQYTPTWIIDGEEYVGVQSIEKLKALTNC